MKTSLQLKQGLTQSLSSEVQQAIELLALPSIELKLHIQSILDKNPLLELDEPSSTEMACDSPLWQIGSPTPDIPDTSPYTVKAYLFWQLELSRWSERDRVIGAYLIDDMNDEGYLESTITDIYSSIPSQYKHSVSEVEAILARIQQFDRMPSTEYEHRTHQHEMHIPDLIVCKQNGIYVVSLNMDFIPQLKIVPLYTASVKASGSAHDKQFMVDALKEARWFLKALRVRHEHLLQTAQAIMHNQYPFLNEGVKAMTPLHYHHIATDTGLHESTICRLVCNKLILTPQGLFELKYFFGNGTQPIQAMIKQLLAEEPRLSPLSDKEMTQLLLSRGFQTTRRTVAKYREAMAIPSSYHRKRGVSYGNSNNRS